MIDRERALIAAPSIFETLSGPNILPIPNGFPLRLNPSQVEEIAENLQAEFNYKPGLTSVSMAPIDRIPNRIYPIQLLDNKVFNEKTPEQNFAVAKAGDIYTYWHLLHQSLTNKDFDFFDLQSFVVVPVLLESSGKPYFVTEKLNSWHSKSKTSKYKKFVRTINYGGDADFTGGRMGKPNHIQVTLPNDKQVIFPHEHLGITPKLRDAMHESAIDLWDTYHQEISGLIESKTNSYPEIIQKLIDTTKKDRYTTHVTAFTITRAYFMQQRQADTGITYEQLEDALDYLKTTVNEDFSKQPKQSPTLKAVERLTESLKNIYEAAAHFYKY